MLSSLTSLAFSLLFIFLCVRGIMWGASLLVLLSETTACLVIGLIILFALPTNLQPVGQPIPYVPVSISALTLLSAILLIPIAQKNKNVPIKQHRKAGIIVLVSGIGLWLLGILFFCLFIFGQLQSGPNPEAAVVTFSTFTLGSTVALYLSTTYESVKYPNIYRWFSFSLATLMVWVIFVASLIFLFAFPGHSATYPFLASITALNYVPVTLLFIGLTRNYVKRHNI